LTLKPGLGSLVYFAPPLNGFLWELGIGAWGQKTRVMGLPGGRISLTMYSTVWIKSTNVTEIHFSVIFNSLYKHSIHCRSDCCIAIPVLRFVLCLPEKILIFSFYVNLCIFEALWRWLPRCLFQMFKMCELDNLLLLVYKTITSNVA